jgi:hypothetical protein
MVQVPGYRVEVLNDLFQDRLLRLRLPLRYRLRILGWDEMVGSGIQALARVRTADRSSPGLHLGDDQPFPFPTSGLPEVSTVFVGRRELTLELTAKGRTEEVRAGVFDLTHVHDGEVVQVSVDNTAIAEAREALKK